MRNYKEKYPAICSILKWWSNQYGGMFKIQEKPFLKEFMIENNPNFKISNKCCKYAKKDLAKSVVKEFNPDLQINGMRKAEGGIRASGQIKSCFSENTDKKEYAEYRPCGFGQTKTSWSIKSGVI